MLRPEVIRKRLENLDEYLLFLQNAQEYAREDFLTNPEYYGSTERFLHLSIEAINDMAGHIIAELDVGTIDQYKDIPELFSRRGWVDEILNASKRIPDPFHVGNESSG